MKHKQRKFTARTALLSALIVSLIASAAIFIGASAAEETVSPTDTARSSVSRSDVTRSNVSRSDVVEMTAAAQAEPKVMEEEPVTGSLQIEMTTSKAAGETMSLTVLGENIFIDWGDGEPVAVDGGNPSPIVGGNTSGTLGDDSVKIYGNVTSLDCNSQQITALNVSKATALTYLNCAGNQLTQLGVENNTALTSLVCADNQLSVLDVSHQASLSLFSCMTNKLTVLDVSHNPALEVFYCSENQLTEIDVSNNPALREFDCSDNRLTSVDIAANPAMECFSCNNNQLTTLDLSNNLNLCIIHCQFNQLTALDVSNAASLAELRCDDNKLTQLNVTNNPALQLLWCHLNSLTSIDVSNNPALRELGLSGNQLTAIDVSNNTALTYFALSNNQLSSLDVSKNTALYEFDCSGNRLSSIDVSNNLSLVSFSCGSNPLGTVDVSKHKSLAVFGCEDSSLRTLDVSKNTALEQLGCENNQLTSLDLSANTSLHFCHCYGNQLKFSTITGNLNAIEDLWILPQQPISIPASVQAGEMVDLSSEYDIGGTKTVYTWYDANGNVVTPTKSENGVFTFGNEFGGKTLHCAMSNAKFPDFKEDGWIRDGYSDDGTQIIGHDGDARLMTTEVKVEKAESTTTTAAPEIDNDLTVTGEEESVVADAGYSDDLKVTDEDGEVVPVGELQLIVSDIDDAKKEAVLEAIERYAQTFHVDENNTALYDLSLVDNNKAHVVIKNGKIKICLKYPDSLAGKYNQYTFKLYHQKADGTIEEVPVTCKANGIWFEATDFSPYALAWNASTGSSPGTGESNVLTWIAVNLALLSLAGAGAVFFRKKLLAE